MPYMHRHSGNETIIPLSPEWATHPRNDRAAITVPVSLVYRGYLLVSPFERLEAAAAAVAIIFFPEHTQSARFDSRAENYLASPGSRRINSHYASPRWALLPAGVRVLPQDVQWLDARMRSLALEGEALLGMNSYGMSEMWRW